MNILLQHQKTSNYVQGTATGKPGWTPDHEKARHSLTGLEAMFFCFNHHVRNMRIVGEFVDRRMDFTLPVTDLRA